MIDFTLNLSIASEEIVHGALGGRGGKKGEENAENGEKNFPEHLLSAAWLSSVGALSVEKWTQR